MIAEISDIKKMDISYNDNKNLQIDGNLIEFIHLEKKVYKITYGKTYAQKTCRTICRFYF